ncbi:MAG: hypothetical protein NAOJABEB_02402 [Steroidobacteraceae bacterium]|nr:hypothetical protein [Steroidobacteraceae bacterium]
MKSIFIGAAALAALAGSATLFAGTDAGNNVVQRSVTVHYQDLNADSQAGAERLYARLKAAARRACGSESGRDLAAVSDYNHCRADALSTAVARVGSRTLTALHRTKVSPLELARFDSAVSAR